MSEPLTFPTASARFRLPFLFAGQAQKEFYYNEAMAIADALLHASVKGEANEPPAAPEDGESWIVGTQPAGEWSDRAECLACFQDGQWLFVSPRDGMLVTDNATGLQRRYGQGWQLPGLVAVPDGGAVADQEARAAIAALIDALAAAGVVQTE